MHFVIVSVVLLIFSSFKNNVPHTCVIVLERLALLTVHIKGKKKKKNADSLRTRL